MNLQLIFLGGVEEPPHRVGGGKQGGRKGRECEKEDAWSCE
jgi:hypothetical protein